MTAPSQPNDPTAGGQIRPADAEIPEAEYGSTAQFQAFVRENDDDDEARDRAAADPDAHRPVPQDLPEDREITFDPAPDPAPAPPPAGSAQPRAGSAQPASRPAQGSVRPTADEIPDAELGSTAQFKAFAAASDDEETDQAAVPERRAAAADDHQVPDAVLPEDRDPTAAEIMENPQVRGSVQPSDLPPVNPDNKRNLYIALAVIVLVAIVVALIYFIA